MKLPYTHVKEAKRCLLCIFFLLVIFEVILKKSSYVSVDFTGFHFL